MKFLAIQDGEHGMATSIPPTPKFFYVEDGGADYWIVADDLEHAKQILISHGVHLTKDDGDSAPVTDPAFAHLEWKEISHEKADTIAVFLDDGNDGPYPLSSRPAGDWFTSEF